MSYAGPAPKGARFQPDRGLAAAEVPPTLPRPGGRQLPASTRPRGLTNGSGHFPGFGAGIALGIVIGAGVALLLTPRTGADVRRDLARQAKRLRNRGEDVWDDLRRELRRARRRQARRHPDLDTAT